MNAALTSGEPNAEVHPGDPLYRDLQLRGYNRRFAGRPDSVFVVDDTDQVVHAVNAVVASGKKLAVRSGGHCVEGLVDDPAVQCVIDLGQMDSVSYDRHRSAYAVDAGATIGRVYQALDMRWGVTLPGGSCTGVGMGGHVTGGGFGPLSRLYGQLADHLCAVEAVVVDEHGKAKAVTATREAEDPHRDLWSAHAGGGGGNAGVATKFWFRSRDGQGDDPTLLLPKRPSGYTMASVAWSWAGENGSFGRGGDGWVGVTQNNVGGGGGGGGDANHYWAGIAGAGGSGGGGCGYISSAAELQATDTVLQYANRTGHAVVTITPLQAG